MPHDFQQSLAASHAAEDLPLWAEAYRKAFPTMIAMCNHRQDGDHQRLGVDRSIILSNSKQILVDEKIRGRNKKTGKVYADIALEYLSDSERGVPGWVCKPLLSDYIAYAIAPMGICYLLPVVQLQSAWALHAKEWLSSYFIASALNASANHSWTTKSCCVPPEKVFSAVGQELRIRFTPCELSTAV